MSAELLFWVIAMGVIVVVILTPIKLSAIHRELKWQSEEMRSQTKLLAAIANLDEDNPRGGTGRS